MYWFDNVIGQLAPNSPPLSNISTPFNLFKFPTKISHNAGSYTIPIKYHKRTTNINGSCEIMWPRIGAVRVLRRPLKEQKRTFLIFLFEVRLLLTLGQR